MGFGALRVINDDIVAPDEGFGTHPHKDMEIISYVVSGELEHKDSLGNGSIIRPGDIQMMRAGTGIEHSEYNPSKMVPTRFLQIWVTPDQEGLNPGYQQEYIPASRHPNHFRLLCSGDGRDGSLQIAQNMNISGLHLEAGQSVAPEFTEERGVWLQIVSGSCQSAGLDLSEGDGLQIDVCTAFSIEAQEDLELIMFDMPTA